MTCATRLPRRRGDCRRLGVEHEGLNLPNLRNREAAMSMMTFHRGDGLAHLMRLNGPHPGLFELPGNAPNWSWYRETGPDGWCRTVHTVDGRELAFVL